MSRKAKGQQIGVALFPFLAVLICTMGALIVLLVLLVQQARVDASVIAAAKVGGQASGADSRLRERLEDAQWQRELLEKSRAEKTDELSQARSRVAHLEEHTQRLAAQAKELLERAKAIDEGKKLREEDMATARAEAAKLKAEIDKKKDELEKAKKKPQTGQDSYALIPYDGRAGTRRRPIYVECTEFGVIIQPEGFLLRAEDFNGPLGPGNPLDSALRAIREHWEKTAGDKAAQPYPLLVVRPSGVVAFGAAKAAISAWDDEWGYELIGDDKNLDFGPPDPVLNASLSRTVAVSRQRQAAMVAMMPRRYQGEEPLKSFAPEPTLAAGNSRYIGGTGGGAPGGSGVGSGTGSGTSGAGSGRGGGANGQASGGGMARSGGYGNGLGTGTGGGNGMTSGTGYGAVAGGQPGGTGRGGTGTYGTGGYGPGSAAVTGAGGNGMAGSGSIGSGIPSVTGGLNGGGVGQSDNLVGRNAASGVGSTGGGAGGDAFPGSGVNGGGIGPGGSSYGTGGGSGGSGQTNSGGGQAVGSGQVANGQVVNGQAGGGQFGSASGGQSMGTSGGGQGGSSTGDPSGGGGGSSFGAGGGSPGGSGSPFSGSSMSAGSPGSMGIPSLNFGGAKSAPSSASGGKSGTGSSSSTAKRGKNWGLPQAKVNQTGVTRPIRVSLQPDRVVMLPEAGDGRVPQVVKIAPELSPDDVNHFVTAVQNEVKGWGLAVADGYWKPVLQVDVAPGAERHYQNLETALHNSGIEITRR